MSTTITLLSWNVNGIRAVAKKGFIPWVQSAAPDILCIQETKASVDQLSPDLVNVAGYHSFWSSAKRKGYSGVAVYSRLEPVRVETSLGIPRFDEEGRVLQLEFEAFTLLNVYFPNGKSGSDRLKFKMDFYDAFLDRIEGFRSSNKPLIFVGDVNTAHSEIDLARPKENEKVSGFLPQERAWIDAVISRGYVDTFRRLHPEDIQYSWWDLKSRARERNVGWRIDYIFATEDMVPALRRAFIMTEVMGSDHCPVGIELEPA
jgi:exodeoxyribonuclease III